MTLENDPLLGIFECLIEGGQFGGVMKMKHLTSIFAIALVCIVIITGCDLFTETPPTTGSITGKVTFLNSSSHTGIVVSLESRTADITRSVSRALAEDAPSITSRALERQTTTTAEGRYSFDNVPEGDYTLYASSKDSSEQAVYTSITVESGRTLDAPDLQLTAVGSIRGRILLDGSANGNMGFIVFIADTSYMAITGDEGNFTISRVPSGSAYDLIIMRGTDTYYWDNVTVNPGEVTELGAKTLLSEDFPGLISITWKGALADAPDSPGLYWAYYNTSDGNSYIYNGVDWDLLAAAGADGADGADGLSIIWKGELSVAPSSPLMNWAYYNSTVGISYIYDGSQWNILAQDGADLNPLPPNNVTNITSQANDSSVTLNWINPSDSDFYSSDIFYKEGTQDYRFAGNTTGTTYQIDELTNGVRYTFLIVSKDTSGNASNGVTVQATPINTEAPNEVSNLLILKSQESITLSWDNPIDDDFDHVVIKYGIGTANITYAGTINPSGTTIEDLSVGVNYIVTIQTVDDANNSSEGISRIVQLEDTIAPNEVSNLKSVNYDGAVLISYASPDNDDFSHYEISYSPMASVVSPLITENDSLYLEGLNNGTSYVITVRTVDLTGNKSSGVSVGGVPDAANGTLQVGGIGPSGGYVFYENPNYATDGWRYMEAAPAGWSGVAEDPYKVWGGYKTTVGGTGTAIGTGAGNTQKIVTTFGDAEPYYSKTDYAAKMCADYRGGGYDDWFLPSKDGLNLMYENLKEKNLGGFSDSDLFWSSSEHYANYAWAQYFNYGFQINYNRNLEARVRPVRAF